MSSDSGDEDDVVRGDDGKPLNGFASVQLAEDVRFEGAFVNGEREGPGCLIFDDGSKLEGHFRSGDLCGRGRYTFDDGTYIEANYENGEIEGTGQEYDENGQLVYDGEFAGNLRHGHGTEHQSDGSKITGDWVAGSVSGDDVVYTYPDGECTLVGRWEDGEMTEAKFRFVGAVDPLAGAPEAAAERDAVYALDESTFSHFCHEPLLPDPYEQRNVVVRESTAEGGGEGLFARRDLPADRVVVYYSGIRISLTDLDARPWAMNGTTMSVGDDVSVDVPPEWISTTRYCGTLGHKGNHHFTPNCKYEPCDHPRFGHIKCLRTLRPIAAGEELFCDYGYERGEEPEWYLDARRRWEAQQPR